MADNEELSLDQLQKEFPAWSIWRTVDDRSVLGHWNARLHVPRSGLVGLAANSLAGLRTSLREQGTWQ